MTGWALTQTHNPQPHSHFTIYIYCNSVPLSHSNTKLFKHYISDIIMEDPKPYNHEPPPFEDADAYTDPDPKDILPPTILILTNQSIHAETSPPSSSQQQSLYQINQPITTSSPRDKKTFTSAKFERVEHHNSPQIASLDPTSISNTGPIDSCQTHHHLFYLAHPTHARYRTDVPAYYITSVSPGMMGNIHFETTKQSHFQKPEFKALLNPNKTASSSPLFFFSGGKTENQQCQLLFNAKAKSKWKSGRSRYRWADADGRDVAFEEEKKLVIIVPMKREMRDVLVALWVLRLWFDTAESRQARREGM